MSSQEFIKCPYDNDKQLFFNYITVPNSAVKKFQNKFYYQFKNWNYKTYLVQIIYFRVSITKITVLF